ncbi:MAG: aspartyl-phosphate phosphatase Spo0E family protein [Clostridium sp.]|uniref:aspartyl-phosphate phosphatase Spo0E family protein n=1 Tax=Clostridium sp. TaxID=1506 RepID=UPI003D6C74AC
MSRDTIEKAMEKIREEINRLVLKKELVLYEGEILKLSQELDKLIYTYYYSKFL